MPKRLGGPGVCALVVACALSAGGCKTFSDYTAKTRSALDAHALDEALAASNDALDVGSAEETPAELGKNDALLLLDRAMVLHASGQYEASSGDFQVADKALEVLDFSRKTSHEISRYLFSDSVGPYKARPYEKLMVNSLNMINYLVRNNLEGAKVEARRFSVMRDFLLDEERKGDERKEIERAAAPGSYFAGTTFEQARQAGEALRYYDEALNAVSLKSLAAPVNRLLKKSGYRSPALQEVAKGAAQAPTPNTDSGEVVIVINYGRVPALFAKRIPVGAALVLAAAFLDIDSVKRARRLAGQGLVTWVNYPELAPAPASYAPPTVLVDEAQRPMELVANVDEIVKQAWERSKGRVIGAAITRMLARAAIGAGVGVGVGKATDKSGLGVLASIIAQGSMAAADKPDTRSWATLPARIGVARMRLPVGAHSVQVNVSGYEYRYDVTVEPGSWTVLSVTDLSQRR